MSTHALFGADVPFEQIAGCRVNRLRVDVAGLRTAIARVALGGRRTQVWLTLVDGRTLSSVAQDDPGHAHALEAFVDALERDRVARWEAALGRGETVTAGKVTMTGDAIALGRRRVRWAGIGGHSFREGGLMIDGASHRLVFTLWVARAPWAGAIHRMLSARAPGRDYDLMAAAAQPRMSFFATSALTHVPGAMTMRGRGYLLLGLVGAGLLAFLIFWIDLSLEEARLQEHWQKGVREDVAAWAPKLADPTFATFAPCAPSEYGRYNTFSARPGEPVGELSTYPNNILIWDRLGADVRGLYLEDRYKDEPPCRIAAPGDTRAPLVTALEAKPAPPP